MTKPHRHRAQWAHRETRPFLHCAYPEHCNPASHGGVTYVDHCRCGARRSTNGSGDNKHTEVGYWVGGQQEDM